MMMDFAVILGSLAGVFCAKPDCIFSRLYFINIHISHIYNKNITAVLLPHAALGSKQTACITICGF